MLTDVVIANRSYTKLSVPESNTTDLIALKVIKQDCPDFLLPIKTMNIDGELEIRYELLDGVRLRYSSMKMNKKDFVVLLENMLSPFKNCNDWFLDYHNILLNADYIMVGRDGLTVKYIYIPAAEYAQSDEDIKKFFEDFIVRIDLTDDPGYTMNLFRILKSDSSNLMTLLDYITKESVQGYGAPDTGEQRMRASLAYKQNGQPPIQPQPPVQPQPFAQPQSPVQPQPAANTGGFVKTEDRGSFGALTEASRPGQPNLKFGKQDVEGNLIGSLFGEDDEDEEPASKKKSSFFQKQTKEPKPAKTKKGGGSLLDGLLKGKPKNKMTSEPETAENGRHYEFKMEETHGSMNSSGFNGNANLNNGANNAWQNQGGYSPYYGDDKTDISEEEEIVSDNNMLRLRLEDSAGYNCPKMIEINLQQGFATVGRVDKSGQRQSDFNFDASLSFISRRHFRVEKSGEYWQIIDLGSGNGTYVNGEALIPNMPHPLVPGDAIMVSRKHRLIYRVC